jgi:hypothetical protein
MPHSVTKPSQVRRKASAAGSRQAPRPSPSRYTVALAPGVADNVARYARTADMSMSKAIATLMRLGLEEQEIRKREFFARLETNLANDDPGQEHRIIDEFRALILG